MKPIRTWILVADGTRARIVLAEGLGGRLKPAMDREFTVMESRKSGMYGDQAERRVAGYGRGGAGVSRRAEAVSQDGTALSKEVAEVIERAAAGRSFDRLVVVAPPSALGRFRRALSPRCRSLVTAEIAKDLSDLSLSDLYRRLSALVPI